MVAWDNTNCQAYRVGVQWHPVPAIPPTLSTAPLPDTPDATQRITLALCLARFSCFLLLYGTQPLLPQLSEAFGISAGTVSLSVTAGTGTMALLLIPFSLVADR